jgi:hypothetical protein
VGAEGRKTDAERELSAKLASMTRGLDYGRNKAIKKNQAERAATDQRMRNYFDTRRRAGYCDGDILTAWAIQNGVKRDTARRRARRLDLLPEAQASPSAFL